MKIYGFIDFQSIMHVQSKTAQGAISQSSIKNTAVTNQSGQKPNKHIHDE